MAQPGGVGLPPSARGPGSPGPDTPTQLSGSMVNPEGLMRPCQIPKIFKSFSNCPDLLYIADVMKIKNTRHNLFKPNTLVPRVLAIRPKLLIVLDAGSGVSRSHMVPISKITKVLFESKKKKKTGGKKAEVELHLMTITAEGEPELKLHFPNGVDGCQATQLLHATSVVHGYGLEVVKDPDKTDDESSAVFGGSEKPDDREPNPLVMESVLQHHGEVGPREKQLDAAKRLHPCLIPEKFKKLTHCPDLLHISHVKKVTYDFFNVYRPNSLDLRVLAIRPKLLVVLDLRSGVPKSHTVLIKDISKVLFQPRMKAYRDEEVEEEHLHLMTIIAKEAVSIQDVLLGVAPKEAERKDVEPIRLHFPSMEKGRQVAQILEDTAMAHGYGLDVVVKDKPSPVDGDDNPLVMETVFLHHWGVEERPTRAQLAAAKKLDAEPEIPGKFENFPNCPDLLFIADVMKVKCVKVAGTVPHVRCFPHVLAICLKQVFLLNSESPVAERHVVPMSSINKMLFESENKVDLLTIMAEDEPALRLQVPKAANVFGVKDKLEYLATAFDIAMHVAEVAAHGKVSWTKVTQTSPLSKVRVNCSSHPRIAVTTP